MVAQRPQSNQTARQVAAAGSHVAVSARVNVTDSVTVSAIALILLHSIAAVGAAHLRPTRDSAQMSRTRPAVHHTYRPAYTNRYTRVIRAVSRAGAHVVAQAIYTCRGKDACL